MGEFTPLLQVTGFVSLLALVGWLVRRVFTHTIPRLATDFKESLAAQQKLFSETLERQQKVFVDALTQQRTDFRESLRYERERSTR